MAERLPDKMTVTLQVLQRFQELGIEPTAEQLGQATNETMGELRRQYFQSLPPGVARYEMEGKKDAAGFMKRMVHTASTMGHNLVAGSIGNALALSDSEWSLKTSEDLRKWANDSVAEQIGRDPELQAYMAWKEDEPSWSGWDTTMRAMSEVIPSLATSIAGTALGIALAPKTGGTSLTATVASLTPMFLLESSSNYIEQMNLMVDEMGMEPHEANQYAGLAAATYGTIASILERTGARTLMKGVPGFKEFLPEKAMMRKITESLIESGADKGTLGRMGMNNLARVTNMVEKAMIEGGTEWSQAALEQTMLYATEHDFKDSNDFFQKLGEIVKSQGVLEEAYGGGVMGVPFGLFLPGSAKSISTTQAKKAHEQLKKEYAGGRFDPDADPPEGGAAEASNNTVDQYLAALANPRSLMGRFWDDFDSQPPPDTPSSKSIGNNRNAQSNSNALLALIVDDPTVIASIEDHADRDSILRLAVDKLNKQNPKLQQINRDDTAEMVHALKMFAVNGSIIEKEAPADLTQSFDEPEIAYDPDWVNQEVPNEEVYYPQYEAPEPTEAEAEAGRKKVAEAGVEEAPVEPVVPTVPDKKLKGQIITMPATLERDKIKRLEGKRVMVAGAGPKAYKVREVDEAGKPIGKFAYIRPSDIEGVAPSPAPTPTPTPEVDKGVLAAKQKAKEQYDKAGKEIISNRYGEGSPTYKGILSNLGQEAADAYVSEIKRFGKIEVDKRLKPTKPPVLTKEILRGEPEVPLTPEKKIEEYLAPMERVQFPPAESIDKAVAIVDGKEVKLTKAEKKKLQKIASDRGSVSTSVQAQADVKLLALGRDLIKKHGKIEIPTTPVVPKVPAGVTTEDVHREAEAKGIAWDDNKEFMDFSERVTGKRKIDDMTSDERSNLISAIQGKVVGKKKYARPKPTLEPAAPKEPTKVETKRVVDKIVALSDDAKRLARSFIALKDAKLTQREAIELTEKGEKFEGFDFSEDGKDWDIFVKELTDTGVFKKVSIKDKYVSDITGEDVFYDSSAIVFDKVTFQILKDYFLDVTPEITGEPLPEDVPDVTKPVESIEELESEVQDNQFRAEQRTKDYLVDGVSYKRVSNVIGTTYSGEPDNSAIKAGNTVDDLVRSFFTEGETPVHDDTIMSKDAFSSLMKALGNVKKKIDDKGLRVLANNIVVWDDGSGVAGEVDLFVLNPETGNIQIWDIKTSKASTKSKRYTDVWKGNGIERSKKQQHEAQLSAYKRIIENQYGFEVEKIAIFPFQVNYLKTGKVTSINPESGISLDFNKAFVDSIIPPNALSQNIVPTPKKEVKEPVSDEPVNLGEEPSDEEIANWGSTIMSRINSQTDEENPNHKGNNVEWKDDDRDMLQEERVSPLPKIISNAELAQKIVSRLRRHFGNYITDDTFEGVLDVNGKRAVGVAIGNVALWSKTDATLDTMPHEYAHIYVGLLKDTDLIKRGINQFGSEEKLVQYIGEYYANRIQNKSILQRIKIWLKQFANRLKNIFGKVPDDVVGDFVAEEFYQGRWAGEVGLEYDQYAKYQPEGSVDEDDNDTGVNSSRHSSSTIGSDIHQKEFFSRVFGVHIPKAQVPVLSELAQKSDSFEGYLEDVKEWAVKIGKEKPYRVAIKTEYSGQDLNDLKVMYLKDRAKIPRHVPKEQVGFFTRVYMSLILPTPKTPTRARIIPSPVERLDTKSAESQYETTNFAEEDLRKGNHDIKIMHFRMKDILAEWSNPDYVEGSDKIDKYKYWQASTKLTEKVLKMIGDVLNRKYFKQVAQRGKDDAQLLFMLGMKGGNDSSILFGKVDPQYNGFKQDDFEEYLNAEVAAKRMKPFQRDVMLEEWVFVDKDAAEDEATKFLKDYKPPLQEGEKLIDAQRRIFREIVPLIQNIGIQRAIAIHEHMKKIKYNTYAMDEKHILDTYTRLRLDLTNGYSPQTADGSLSSRVMVVPKETIVKVRTQDGKVHDAGVLGDGDGQTMTGSEWFGRLGDNIGTPDLSVVKTVIRHRSKDGEHYIAMKHLQSTPFLGMEFYRKGENTPFARVARDEGGTYFEALDKDGNVTDTFQHLNSPNESKNRAGDFTEDYKVNDLLESDVKVIMNPVGSSNTAAHPIALGEILLDPSIIDGENTPEAKNLAKAITKHYGAISKDYLEMLKDMRENPKTFLDAVKRTREEERIPTDAEKWMDLLDRTEGKGVAHKFLTNMFVAYLKNRYFSDGIYKGRMIARGNATHAYLKPAWHLENLIDDGNVAVSYDNKTVRDKVIRHWASLNRASIEKNVPEAAKWNDFKLWHNFSRNMRFRDQVNTLNEALGQGEGINVIIHRQPIAKVTGVVTRRVQFLVTGGHGDTMFLKKKDVTEVLDGDWDGDHGFAEFIDGDFLKAYKDWQESDTFKDKDRIVALPMFGEKLEETEDSNTTYLSSSSRNVAILGEASVSGAQGRVTNAKVVMTQLAYKQAKLYFPSLEGGYISAKNPSAPVTMGYKALDINQLNKKIDGVKGKLLKLIIDNGDTIVNNKDEKIDISIADGEYSIQSKDDVFLRTTVEGELAILLQMAVDNKKFGLLAKIKWDKDFVIRRIFNRSDGEALNKGNIQSLNILFNVQNFSAQRGGLTPQRNVASMNRIVEDARTLAERFFKEDGKKAPREQVGTKMREEFVEQKSQRGYDSKAEIPTLIDTNGKITPGESLLASVGVAFNDLVGDIQDMEKFGSHFLDYAEDAYRVAHSKTMDEIGRSPEFNQDKWNNNDLGEALNFITRRRIDVLGENEAGDTIVVKKTSVNDAFWQIYKDAQRKNQDDVPLHISADYDKFLSKFVEDHIDDWLSLSENAQDMVTALFLKGLGGRTNIMTLMPIDLMSERIMEKYLPSFESKLKNLKESDYSAQTGTIKDMAGYQNLGQFVPRGMANWSKAGKKKQARCK